MSLSEQVEGSLINAQEHLKDALAFSVRSEKPYVSKHIADMLANIDNLCAASELLDTLENNDIPF